MNCVKRFYWLVGKKKLLCFVHSEGKKKANKNLQQNNIPLN